MQSHQSSSAPSWRTVVRVSRKLIPSAAHLQIKGRQENIAQQRRHHAPNAKANFQFERVIRGWRDGAVLDLRLKK
jgi:hypothetical protein